VDDFGPEDVQNIRHAIRETYPTRHPEVLAKFDAILRWAALAYREHGPPEPPPVYEARPAYPGRGE
jgi:hypothetical protein